MDLRNVTFVVIDRVAHALTKLAIEESLKHCTPEEILIWTDQPDLISIPGAITFPVEPGDIETYNHILYYEVPQELKTSHFLTIEWDGWIISSKAWRNEFLEFDYIGAPWPFHASGNRVGNGGFSLRSKNLTRFLMENKSEFPPIHAEDHWLCREYGPRLMDKGFKWADEYIAQRFSFENGPPHPDGSFGFHDCRNWRHIMSEEEVQKRLSLETTYLNDKCTWQAIKAGDKMRHVK